MSLQGKNNTTFALYLSALYGLQHSFILFLFLDPYNNLASQVKADIINSHSAGQEEAQIG